MDSLTRMPLEVREKYEALAGELLEVMVERSDVKWEIAWAIHEAVVAEREACARIAEDQEVGDRGTCIIADLIRARGK